ncbi:MAG: class I SAM-dependent methyltransferase [Patescibacteria group bacterium]
MGAEPAHVMDLGCGTGDTLAKFCARGIGVTGIDFSTVALQEAGKRLRACKEKLVLIEADLEHLHSLNMKTPAGTLWLCKLVLAFIKDKTKFLEDVRGKMNVGDMLFVMTPVLHEEILYTKEDKPGIALRLEEADILMSTIFGDKHMFSNEYPGERGHIISYLVKK